jgi:hypothetical protein
MSDAVSKPPRLVADAIASSCATAEIAGTGRLWMDLGLNSRLHLCDPRVPEAIDVIFEDWGCFALKDGLSPGEQSAASDSARRFSRAKKISLLPLAVFLDYRGRLKITMAGARDPQSETLYIWPQDIMPRKMVGPAACRQAMALDRHLADGWAPGPEVEIERLANRLAMG